MYVPGGGIHNIGETTTGSMMKFAVPRMVIDYFFLTETGLKLRNEMAMDDETIQKGRSKGEIVKCIIVAAM